MLSEDCGYTSFSNGKDEGLLPSYIVTLKLGVMKDYLPLILKMIIHWFGPKKMDEYWSA